MNILDLLREDGFSFKKVGNHDGGVYGSPCPWCGGQDRFRSWPESGNGGNWYCQKCSRRGDTIKYVMDYRGKRYLEACTLLGRSPCQGHFDLSNQKPRFIHGWEPSTDLRDPPPPEWQDRARNLIKEATSELLTGIFTEGIRSFLYERGLTEETIESTDLGYIYGDIRQSREDWGLPSRLNKNGNPSHLWIPHGLLIPYIDADQILRIKIRRFGVGRDKKYYLLSGSRTIPMVWGEHDSFVIVESELDGLLLYQEAGDLVTIVAMGSANMRPDSQLTEKLIKAHRILIALDNDEAGAHSSYNWWLQHFTNAVRWPVPFGKDPTEAYQQGLNLRTWVHAGLEYEPDEEPEGDSYPIDISRPTEKLPYPEIPPIDFKLFTDGKSLSETLHPFHTSDTLAIHIETTGKDPFTDKIRLIQLSIPNHPVLAIDLQRIDKKDLASLQTLLDGPAEKVFHDAKSTMKFHSRVGIHVTGPIFDTMLASQALTAGLEIGEHSLENLAKWYLKRKIPSLSSKNDWNGELIENQIQLSAWKASTIADLKEDLSIRLKKAGLEDVAQLEFDCIAATVEMELNGILVDKKRCEELHREVSDRKSTTETQLKAILRDINLDSSDQIVEALHSNGIPVEKTNQTTLIPFFSQHPVTKGIVIYRKLSNYLNNISSWLESILPQTGRIHPEIHQLGSATGRFSCSNPNIQGTPNKTVFRSCFIPQSGQKLVKADYSQIELRVTAEITQDPLMIQAYQNQADLHKLTASLLMGKTIDQVNKEDRQKAKAVNFGLIFGMGPSGLCDTALKDYGVTMTLEEAEQFRRSFFDSYKGIAAWQERISESLPRQTRTILGRRRIWKHQPKITELLNSPVQGTAADIIKKALGVLASALKGTDSMIIACVHDEIILEVNEDNSQRVAEILRETMETAGRFFLKTIPVVVDVSVGDSWAEK